MSKFWTHARITELKVLWAQGWTYKQIGDHMGVAERAVEYARFEYDLPRRNRGRVKGSKNVVTAPVKAFAGFDLSTRPASDIPWPDRARLMAGR